MNTLEGRRHPLPPFDEEGAVSKVRLAEDAWNSRDPGRMSLAYSADSRWRNTDQFLQGRPEIIEFLSNKWDRELDYRLVKELWIYHENRIAVRFAYEWHDADGHWYRSHGNENWEFDDSGLMTRRLASINDQRIRHADRRLVWTEGPRPRDYPSLSELGL
jgi:nuclear transport factor 2 (NTF2) superfamily protein